LKALDQLKTLLDQPTEEQAEGTGAPSEGLVKYRRALFEFAKAKDLVSKQIGALKKAIPATLPDEAGLAEEIASELMSWNEDLSEVINDAINASEDEDEPTSDSIRTSIAATLGNALRKIQQAMPAHA